MPSAFELVGALMSFAGSTLIVVAVYRPGGDPVNSQFYDELTAVFEQLAAYSCPVVVTGDLNLHLDVTGGRDARRLQELLDTFGLHQSVSSPTHRGGHTLDVVISRADLPLPVTEIRPCDEFSDHSLVLFQLPLPRPPLRFVEVSTRAWKGFDEHRFRGDLLGSPLCLPSADLEGLSVDVLQDMYGSTLASLLDKHAPRRVIRRRHQPTTPWFDSDCVAAKRRTRAFERRYRRTCSSADRCAWIDEVRRKHRLYASKQNGYWEDKIAGSHGKPLKLWSNLSAVLRRQQGKSPAADGLSAESFLAAFSAKTESVRSSTASASGPTFDDLHADCRLDAFQPVDVTAVQRLISSAANKNCELDPAPTWLVKKFAYELSPFITALFNTSFRDGLFPSTQKCAMITPVLKKPTLDASDASNYRPISNLTFLSKLLERCAYDQINSYLQRYNLLPEQQSAYRRCHSTETAMLKVLGDAYVAADAGQLTLLSLLDLSAAFDTVDHWILLERLRRSCGVIGLALGWIMSYLSGRTQFIRFNGAESCISSVVCGVPQGSVLGPVLFLLYAAGVIKVVHDCGLSVHAYADDLQVYGHVDPAQSAELMARTADCVARVEVWMANNRLRLNPTKTEVIWLGSTRRLTQCTADLLELSGASVQPSHSVRDLGVVVDRDLSLAAHVSHITSVCFFHLRQLRLIRRSLTTDAAHALVRALIHSRLDYCNGLFAGLPAGQFTRLQSVLRAAARLVLRLPGRAPVSTLMRDQLHWLCFPQRVTFKLCLMTYKCLHGQAPAYLSHSCVPLATVAGRSQLRSADVRQLLVPRSRTVTLGPRAFCTSGPSSWNMLPSHLREPDISQRHFRQLLKTYLFAS
jgi:Reverse transcriptase (RNA-dependent DNA polymerase)/Endonuclease-reverse transcriptase